eukprot:gene5172-7199_t
MALGQRLQRILLERLPLIYILFGSFGFSVERLFSKLLAEYFNGFSGAFEIVFSRGVCQLALGVLMICKNYRYDFTNRNDSSIVSEIFGSTNFVRSVLFLRCAFGFISQCCTLLAIEFIPIGDATVIGMLSPSIAAAGGYFILGEPWRLFEFLATVTSLTGVMLVSKPTLIFGGISNSENVMGILIALLGAICQAIVFILLRMLGTSAKIHWANVIFTQSIGQIILVFPASYAYHEPMNFNLNLTQYIMVVCAGAIGTISQVCVTVGMQREKSALASGMRMADILFGFIFQIIFTSDKVDTLSILGATMVSASIVLNIASKSSNDSSSSHPSSLLILSTMAPFSFPKKSNTNINYSKVNTSESFDEIESSEIVVSPAYDDADNRSGDNISL